MTTFEVGGVLCTVKRSARSQYIRLSVESGGRVTLSLPHRVTLLQAEQFLREREEWIQAAHARAVSSPTRLLAQGSEEEYRERKEEARRLISARAQFFAERYGVTYRRLSLRNQQSRFGSCSAQGQLSFNYRLLFLPPRLCDYVVVHEVCHLLELNHSPRFWKLVARTFPDYEERKRELQAYSRPGGIQG